MNKEIKKPSFDIEVKAEIKGVAKIEDNIAKVKEVALAMKDYYSTVEFESEEDIKVAIDEKKKVNNFKDEVANYRKNIIAEYKKPIELFENTAKETESILKEVYEVINKPVDVYREKEKQKTIDKAKAYFEEYQTSKNIDFIKYEDARINITLGTSDKKAKEEVKEFIDRIATDLEVIETDENSTEILVEYKNNGYNVSSATLTVRNRIKAIEEAKQRELARQEQLKKQQETVQKVEQVLETPKIVSAPKIIDAEIIEEKIELTTITVKNETKERLQAIIKFLENGGYDYE